MKFPLSYELDIFLHALCIHSTDVFEGLLLVRPCFQSLGYSRAQILGRGMLQ